jgi:hypothetical protein
MSWLDKKSSFQHRIDELAMLNVDGELSKLKQLIATYVQTAGLSQDATANPTYTAIQQQIQVIADIKNNYMSLQDDITSFLSTNARDLDLSGTLQENGHLQKDIQRLEKRNTELNHDVETAVARDELLRSKNTEKNAHTLFVMDRPIKKGMIPVLWAITIIFIGIALAIVRTQLGEISLGVSPGSLSFILEYVTHPIVVLSAFAACIITIIILSLKVARVF